MEVAVVSWSIFAWVAVKAWNTVAQRRGSEAGQFQVARPVVEVDAVVMMGPGTGLLADLVCLKW